MSQVKQAGVVKASYRYNAKGERVSRADNATGAISGYTLYDEAGHWLGDYDANGATKQQAIWLGDAPVGLVVGAGVAQTLRYVQPDHLGTPRAVIDPSRNLAVWTWDAKGEAFGNNPPNQDPDQDGTAFVFDMRFPGQRFDAATGLSYNYFRDYDAATGRYVQSDPIGLEGGISGYSYVNSRPFDLSDPLGLKPKDCYISADIAAANAVAETLPNSIKNNWEYGGWVYKTAKGYYSYTEPKTSWDSEYVKIGEPPKGVISLGKYHTHAREPYPAKPIRETFSGGDIRIPYGQLAWVGTPAGKILRYSSMGRADTKRLPQPAPNNGDACDCSAPIKSAWDVAMEFLGFD
ncbi:RHS repeat-associated core domain-containing protein [Lysobacter sp. 1R34A]|uniref:RHS repeat-associated core domain-containing protein n=1 Tax=Lysobacter sp. 1R34A TaxID=3445786 RepID=UPI003EE95F1C